MTLTLALNWWTAPSIITGLAILWALFWPADDGGYLGGITRLFMLIPALLIGLISWVVGAIFK